MKLWAVAKVGISKQARMLNESLVFYGVPFSGARIEYQCVLRIRNLQPFCDMGDHVAGKGIKSLFGLRFKSCHTSKKGEQQHPIKSILVLPSGFLRR
jgi:hypothetical protein